MRYGKGEVGTLKPEFQQKSRPLSDLLLISHFSLLIYSSLSTAFEIGMVISNFGSMPPKAEPETFPCLSRMTNEGSWSTLNFLSVTEASEYQRTDTAILLPTT